MSLRFCSLGSSSAGNCYYIESDGGTRILVDAGIPLRRLEHKLQQLDVDPASIQGVFLTHAHRDHVASYLIKHPFATRYGLHSYASTPTWHALLAGGCGHLEHDCCHRLEAGDATTVGDLTVSALAKPHDAAGAVCYRISAAQVSMAVVTDLGYLPPELIKALRGCQYYVFEANHDEVLEKQSERPWSLKQRVLGDYGHLSNDQAAEGLAQLASEAKGIYLAHLSEECNLPDLATLVVRERLRREGLDVTVVHLPARGISSFYGEPRRPMQLALVGEED